MSSALRKTWGWTQWISDHAGLLNYDCQPLKHVSLWFPLKVGSSALTSHNVLRAALATLCRPLNLPRSFFFSLVIEISNVPAVRPCLSKPGSISGKRTTGWSRSLRKKIKPLKGHVFGRTTLGRKLLPPPLFFLQEKHVRATSAFCYFYSRSASAASGLTGFSDTPNLSPEHYPVLRQSWCGLQFCSRHRQRNPSALSEFSCSLSSQHTRTHSET